MKKVSVIAILSVVIPSLANAEWEYSITDSNIRNSSYTATEISQNVYNTAKNQNSNAPVFQTNENGETKYYKWIAPDLTQYKAANNADIFSLTDQGKGSVDFLTVDNNGNVSTKSYYYTNLSGTNNHKELTSGAIALQISGDFIENNNYYTQGGAICNSGRIEDGVVGNFIRNSASHGGAIYKDYGAKINSITGNFIGNEATYSGGAIYIDAGAGTNIETITGNFIGNHAGGSGAAIVNNSTINSITANFIGNYANHGGDNRYDGGAIYNVGTINSITGDFIGNSTGRFGGAIVNQGNINSITGDFIGNSATYNGGAIYNSGMNTIIFVNNVLFSDNHALQGGAIYNINDGNIIMNIDENSSVRFDTVSDDIYNDGTIGVYGTTSENPGHLYLQSVYGNGSFNLNNTHAYLADGQSINQTNLNIDELSVLYTAADRLNVTNIYNNGLISLTSGTLSQKVSSYGHIEISGSVFANADYLGQEVINNGILTLNSGNLMYNVTGTGSIILDGDIISDVNMIQNTIINESKSLTVSIDHIKDTNLTNNGNLWFVDTGTLDKSLSNYVNASGSVGNIGTLLSDANKINCDFTNNGILILTSGMLNGNITGTGSIKIDGDVISSNYLLNSTATIINVDKRLTISANNIVTDNLTNNGTLTLTGGTLNNNISGSGNIVINGDVTSGVAIAQNTTINNGKSLSIHVNNLNSNLLTNNGTLYFTGTGGTLTTNIGGLGTVVNNGELSADIQYITNNFSNNGTLNLLGGEINGAISGTGNITIAGDVTSNVALNQNTTINSGKSLTTSANNIVNSNITNNGTLRLSGGELGYAVNGNGNIINTGNLITNADFVNSYFANNGTLTLSSGTLAYNVTGNGNMVINGSVNASAQITQETSINNGKSLEIAAGNMRNTLTNNGTVLLSGGELNYTVNGNGTANIIGNVVNNATNSNAIEIGNGARFTTSSDLLTNNSDIINNGELNIIAGTLHNDVIGGKTVIASNAVLESSNIGNVEMNGIWNVGSNTVHTGNTTINGTVNLNITDFAKDSSEYTGGKIIANNVTLGDDAKLRLVVSSENNLVREGDSSGDLFVIQNDGLWIGNWDSLLEENARYSITYNQNTHGIRIVKTNDIIDIATENHGNISDVAVAKAWINETHSDNSQIQAIIDRLNYTSQYDVPAYMGLLNDLTPINSQVVSGTSRVINTALNNIISERIALLGRNGGDSFNGVGIWGQSLFNHSSQSGDSEFTGDTLGFGLGVDKRFSSKSLLGMGYVLNNTSATSGTHDISATWHTLFVYAEFRPEQTYIEDGVVSDDVFSNIKHKPSPLYMTGLLSYGITNYTDDTPNNIKSEYKTSTIGINGTIGYNLTDVFDVYMGTRYLKISQDDYTDTAGQKVAVEDDNIITGYFGGKYTGKGSVFVPNAHLSLSYDIKSNDKIAVINTEHSNYQIAGDSINPFGVQAGFGFDYHISNWNLSLNYDLDWHPEFMSHTGRIKAKYVF